MAPKIWDPSTVEGRDGSCGRRPSVSFRAGRLLVLVSAMALVTGVAAACGGAEGEDTGGAGEASESLRVNIGAEPGSIDIIAQGDGQATIWASSVYEGLTGLEGDEAVPELATEWSLDGNTWVFTLREDATFHNGEPVTAEDVVASFKRLNSEGSDNRGTQILTDTVVEAIDDSTVGISRPVVDPTIPRRAALVAIAPAELADASNDALNTEMMGTGPYKFDGWDRTQNIRLSAYEGYWGEQPDIQEVVITFNPEAAVRLSALQAGEIDLAFGMPADLATSAEDFTTFPFALSEVAQLRLNTLSGPLANQRLREAVSLAIDRDLIIEELYGTFAQRTGGQPVASYVFGYDEGLEPLPYEPEQARQILEEEDAVGTVITLVGSRGRWVADAEVGEAVAEMLTDVGFQVALEQPPFSDWLEAWFGETEVQKDAVLVNHSSSLYDSSFTVGQLVVCEGATSVHCDPAVDAMELAASAETDPEARAEIYHELWALNHEQLWLVPIAEAQSIAVAVPNLEWTPADTDFPRFQDMSFAD